MPVPIPPFTFRYTIQEWEDTTDNRPIIEKAKEELFENGKCRSLLYTCHNTECISRAPVTFTLEQYYTIPKYISTTETPVIGGCMSFTVQHVCPFCGEKFYTFLIMNLETGHIISDVSVAEKKMEILTNFIKNFAPNPNEHYAKAIYEARENIKQYYFGASKVPNSRNRKNYIKDVGRIVDEKNTPKYYHPILFILKYLPSVLLPEILTVATPKLRQPVSKIVFK